VNRRIELVRAAVAVWSVVWLIVRMPHNLGLADLADRRWYPVGVLTLLDAPPAPGLAAAVLVAGVPLGVAVAAGRWTRVTTPLWAAALLLAGTYVSSWGQLFHTENLLVLHALVLAAAALRPRVDAKLVLDALVVVTVAAYVVAGVAKLRGSGWDWFDGDILRNKVAFDNVRKAVIGAPASPFATTAVHATWLWPPLAVLTVVVELGAPVALLRNRSTLVYGWIVAAWAFHVGILALMAIAFPYQLLGLAYLPLLPLERLRRPSRTLGRRWIASSSPSPSSP
jgi:hypothetical protein